MRARAPVDRNPGDLQLEILEVLWTTPELTAAAVRERLGSRRVLALTTVATVLQRMDKAGLVDHRVEGRQHLYFATVSREHLQGSGVWSLIRRLFNGSPAALVSHLMETEGLTAADRARIRALLKPHRRK